MECCALVLAMLTKTQYDEELVAIQINSNIVNILIQKLEWTGVLSTIITVPSHVKRKRKGRYFDRHNSKKPRLVVVSYIVIDLHNRIFINGVLASRFLH